MSQLPRPQAPMVDRGGLPSREWYDYLRAIVANSGDDQATIDAILARLDALEEAGTAILQGPETVKIAGSLAGGLVQFRLENDQVDPPATHYYGTDASDTKGFHAISDTVEVEAGELTKAVAGDGVTTFGLADVTPSSGGTLQLTQFDAKGRRSHEGAADTDDLPEGSANLYFTDERAQDATGAILADSADIDFTYDDDAPSISAVLTAGVHASLTLADSSTQPGDNISTLTNDAGYVPASALGTAAYRDVGNSGANLIPTLHPSPAAGQTWLTLSGVSERVQIQGVAATPDGDNAPILNLSAYGGPSLASSLEERAAILSLNTDGATPTNRGGRFSIVLKQNNSNALATRLMVRQNGEVTAGSDNSQTLGSAALRWSTVYAVTGAINTSDARDKVVPRHMSSEELAAAKEIAALPCVYQWLSAIEVKGGGARLHVSPTVQDVIACMERQGIDPFRYGLVCYDEWDEQPEVLESWEDEYDADGVLVRAAGSEVTQEYRPAGDRYSLRPSELAHFLVVALHERVSALEAA